MMGHNRSRQDREHDLVDDGTWEDEIVDGDAEDGDGEDDERMDAGREADLEAPDRGYEINLDEHSPVDLDEAIKEAVEAVERAGQTGGNGNQEAEPPEAAQLQDRLLRTLADFDNYRKRTDREKESLRRLGVIDVMRDALSISDNLERALQSPGGIEDLKQGVELILRQHQEFLRRHGVEGFESMGQRFDPAVHEAVATRASSEIEEPTVSEELQKGYRFHDQLLRPALVYVAMPDKPPAAAAEKPPSAAGQAEGVEEVEEEPEEVEGRQGD